MKHLKRSFTIYFFYFFLSLFFFLFFPCLNYRFISLHGKKLVCKLERFSEWLFNSFINMSTRWHNCMCFSAINGSGPAYLSELLHVYAPSRTLRSSSVTRMLEIQQYKRKTHGFRTISCFGPHIWNSLPQDLRHCSTLSSFKAKLKTFLFSQYFHPN